MRGKQVKVIFWRLKPDSTGLVATKSGRWDVGQSIYMGNKMNKLLSTALVCATLLSAGAVLAEKSGEEVYSAVCGMCHANAIGGAPMTGDAQQWAPRLAKGIDTLYNHAINGLQEQGMMPAMGMCMQCSEDEVKAAVDYMLEQLPK